MTDLSIVIPVYNEECTIPLLIARLVATIENIRGVTEIIFVNDGSTDGTKAEIKLAVNQDHRFKLVNLSRNFGHQQAISAGLATARGRAVVVMDADLQDPPEFIPKLIEKLDEGYDVVFAVRGNRKGRLSKRIAYHVFYRLVRKISQPPLPIDAGDFAILRRRVVDEICRMPEYHRYLRGLRAYVGFRQTGIVIDRPERVAGESKYSVVKLLYLASDGIFSFSEVPLRLASIVGILIAVFAMAYGFYLVVWRLITGTVIPGFATIAVAILLVGGIQLVFLGVLGEYLGRVYNEVKRRPSYVIDSIYSKPASDEQRRD